MKHDPFEPFELATITRCEIAAFLNDALEGVAFTEDDDRLTKECCQFVANEIAANLTIDTCEIEEDICKGIANETLETIAAIAKNAAAKKGGAA